MNRILHRICGLIMFGCALSLCVPTGRATNDWSSHVSAALATPSPEPTPTRERNRPNPVRRFFSWTGNQIARPFRKEPQLGCTLPPMITSITTSKSLITICQFSMAASRESCSPDREITLTANATAPDDLKFFFTWSVTGGKLLGEGRTVTWDLTGLPEGSYTATAEMDDGFRHTATGSATVTIAVCPNCDPPPPPCPTVSVSCPSSIEKQPITFEAIVAGGEPGVKLTYNWTVTAGKIISGQGTYRLTVDTSNLDGRSATATVSLEGAHPACTISPASCTINIHGPAYNKP